jgi:branched-chain amino acid transport system substrate-binding protein
MFQKLLKATLPFVAATLFGSAVCAQGVSNDEILIGGVGPITGPAAYIGLGGRDGLAMAIKEINAAGGVNGRKFKLIFEDDGHSPTKALGAVKKLIDQDKVFMIFGAGGSNATVGTIDYVKEQKRVMYVSFASAPAVTYPFSAYLFRGATTEVPRYGELYSEFIAEGLKAKKVAIMNGREEYPKNEGNALATSLKDVYKADIVARVEFNIGDKDFTPQLLEVKKSGAQVVAFFGNPAEAAIAMRQARELGIEQKFFVGATMVDKAFTAAAKENAEGATGFSLIPLLPGTKNADLQTWEAKWKKEYPNLPVGRPNVFDVMAYTDMYVIAEAMKKAGRDLNTTTLISGLEQIKDFSQSVLASPITFTTKHHIGNLTLTVMEVKGGEWQPIGWKPARPSEILKRYE